MNKSIIMGRMTKDPELKTSKNGVPVLSFSVAVDRPKAKEKAVDYFDCVAFYKTAEFISNHFYKGKPIMIEGYMQSRKWEKDGVKRTSWELIAENVEFCGGEKKQNVGAPATSENPFDPNDLSGTPFDMNDPELDALPL